MPTPVDYDAIQTLPGMARYHARLRPGRPAFIYDDRVTSWAEFDQKTDRVAHALIAAGLGIGDRIGYIGKGNDAYFELLFGASKAGVIMVPVQWRLAPAEMGGIVADAQPALLFVTAEFSSVLPEVAAAGGALPVVAVEGAIAGWPENDAWREAAPPVALPEDVDPGNVILFLYTSGTTGVPKGVMHSHRSVLDGRRDQYKAAFAWNGWSDEDVNLVAMPVAHIAGTGAAINGSFHGAANLIHAQFEAKAVLEAFQRYNITKLFLVPAAVGQLLREPNVREIDYSKLQTMFYGSSPITLDLLREAVAVFGCGFCQNYGMTETSGTIVLLPPSVHEIGGNRRMRSAGLPLPGVKVRIVDPDSRAPFAPGQTGEIELMTAQAMVGYWRKPEETARVLPGDGWVRTGDAGYLDDDGYLYVHDRIKDMIVSGGENVYPAEVENAMFGHPAVADVAVIGVPDAKWGEAVKACVVLKPGHSASAEDLIAFARNRIAGFKLPKTVDFIPELPRNPAGKILKRVLRAPFWDGQEREVG
jgi:acyl-CoA synthetase (AMP-forming)/AMP-acid ligase II